MFKVKTVAEKLACSQTTVYSLIASGKLRHYRIGVGRGGIRVSAEHIAEFLSGAEARPAICPRPVKLKHLRL
jgi:excisionase family DNA binding protein